MVDMMLAMVKENEMKNNQAHQKMYDKMEKLLVAVTDLKARAGMWGAIGGAIPVVIGLGVWFLKKESG